MPAHNFIDLTGLRFGRLTVQSLDAIKGHRQAYWITVCDCGARSSISGRDLRRGHSAQCAACGRAAKVDLTGQTFGSLIVTGYQQGTHDKEGHYDCQCACGATVSATRYMLQARALWRNACPACYRRIVKDRTKRLAEERRIAKRDAARAFRSANEITVTETCAFCLKQFTYNYVSSMDTPHKWCSLRCRTRHKRMIQRGWRRAVALRCQNIDKHADPMRVMRRDKYICQVCGGRCDPALYGKNRKDAPQCDHKVGLASGGAHTEDNMQCAHQRCNFQKSEKEGTAKLTFEIAEQIRAEHAMLKFQGHKRPTYHLSIKWGISIGHMQEIIARRVWRAAGRKKPVKVTRDQRRALRAAKGAAVLASLSFFKDGRLRVATPPASETGLHGESLC